MNSTIETPATETKQPKANKPKANETQGNPLGDAANNAETQALAEQKEYDAILAADLAFSKAVVATGFNVILRLARDMGRSVDKFGYPALSAHRRLMEAAAIRNVTHRQFDAICGAIRSAVGTDPDRKMSDEDIKSGREKCVTGRGKGKQGRSSLTLALKAPKAWDIAAE